MKKSVKNSVYDINQCITNSTTIHKEPDLTIDIFKGFDGETVSAHLCTDQYLVMLEPEMVYVYPPDTSQSFIKIPPHMYRAFLSISNEKVKILSMAMTYKDSYKFFVPTVKSVITATGAEINQKIQNMFVIS